MKSIQDYTSTELKDLVRFFNVNEWETSSEISCNTYFRKSLYKAIFLSVWRKAYGDRSGWGYNGPSLNDETVLSFINLAIKEAIVYTLSDIDTSGLKSYLVELNNKFGISYEIKDGELCKTA